MDTVLTQKGTKLPLVNLKGKSYLQVAYRMQWLAEVTPNYHIETQFTVLNDEQTVARATVTILNEKGEAVRRATATKRETKKDFADHTEKAETGAIGRALAMLGFGTQHALADLDEGERLADAPLQSVKAGTTANTFAPTSAVVMPIAQAAQEAQLATVKKNPSFKRTTKTEEVTSNGFSLD